LCFRSLKALILSHIITEYVVLIAD